MSEKGYFYEYQRESSQIKSKIVEKYFLAWAKIISKRSDTIAYVDLFAGQGRFDDGNESTPLLILQQAISINDLAQKLLVIFNDSNKIIAQRLEKEIANFPNIHLLRYKPKVYNLEVGEEETRIFDEVKDIPTLFFVDCFRLNKEH